MHCISTPITGASHYTLGYSPVKTMPSWQKQPRKSQLFPQGKPMDCGMQVCLVLLLYCIVLYYTYLRISSRYLVSQLYDISIKLMIHILQILKLTSTCRKINYNLVVFSISNWFSGIVFSIDAFLH